MTNVVLSRIQTIIAGLYLPHEIGHYLAILPWCPDAEIHLSVPKEHWTHPYIPAMGQVTGTIPDGTSTFKVRIAALGPTILFVLIAVAVIESTTLPVFSVQYFAVLGLLLFYALPSGMDLHTFSHPSEAIEAGVFGAAESTATWVWDLYAIVFNIGLCIVIFLYPLVV